MADDARVEQREHHPEHTCIGVQAAHRNRRYFSVSTGDESSVMVQILDTDRDGEPDRAVAGADRHDEDDVIACPS